MIKILICICTRKRQQGLKKLLDSIENMESSPDTNIRIVVVENDMESYSEDIVKAFSSKSKFRISYFLETRQGLAFARNRAIKEAAICDFCCFFDDDQTVKHDCLEELLRCQVEFGADGISGQCPPLFLKEVPAYIRDFHTRKTHPYGAILKYAGTGCLLLRKKYLDMIDGPFDVRLNFTGGEDILLTSQISKLGGIIRYNPNAIAYEIIPNERTTIKYIARRSFRNANTEYFVKYLINENFNKIKIILKLLLRLGFGLLIVIPFLFFGKSNKLKGLIKISNSVGGFYYLMGRQNQFYR
jgi:succinoglycan biosynthesis protein ExoM